LLRGEEGNIYTPPTPSISYHFRIESNPMALWKCHLLIILSLLFPPITANDYILGDSLMTWQDGDDWCMSNHGQHLASIRTADDSNSAITACNGNECWIGGHLWSLWGLAYWAWSDYSSWDFTAWSVGEPNNWNGDQECTSLISSGTWNDVNCDYQLYPLCGNLVSLVDQGFDPCPGGRCLNECEGDCDTDDDCSGNLRCFHRDTSADGIPPGCMGTAHYDAHDYCYDSGDIALVDYGTDPTWTLDECEGDCDSDNSCAGDLRCWFLGTLSTDNVPPGCHGTPANTDIYYHDYCYDPEKRIEYVSEGLDPCTSPGCLNECEGDCDTDSDCAGDLVCWQLSTSTDPLAPGCKGDVEYNWIFGYYDYCYDANNNIDNAELQTAYPTIYTSSPSVSPLAASPTPRPTEASDVSPGDQDADGGLPSDMICKGFNFFTAELSGSLILDTDKFESMIDHHTTDGQECSYSSLEFSKNFNSFSSYATEDAHKISTDYNAIESPAGGSLSTTRKQTRSTAKSTQSYIYDMQFSCVKSHVALHNGANLWWNSNFLDALRTLPQNCSADEDLRQYVEFWESYGTHIVKTAEYGGKIKGTVIANKCTIDKSFTDETSYEACLNAEYSGAGGDACTGSTNSNAESTSASIAIENKYITVQGGDSSFGDIVEQFDSKNAEFSDWVNSLLNNPFIVGGNVDEIHHVLLDALNVGDHHLNDGLTTPLSDDEWTEIAMSLKVAYEHRCAQLDEQENVFQEGECDINCQVEGKLDEANCVCDCETVADCCPEDGASSLSVLGLAVSVGAAFIILV